MPENGSGNTKGHFIDAIIIAVFSIAVYANTFGVPFYFDDFNFIVRNLFIRDLSNFIPPFDASLMPGPVYELTFSRFFGFLSFALNYRLHGLYVGGYHITNLFIHITCSLFLYWFIVLLHRVPSVSATEPQARATALVAALLFAVHPVQTQAVTYIGQRFASLVALFYIGSMVFYLDYRLARTRGRAGAFLLLSLLLGFIAIRTKENAFTLPFAVLALECILFSGPILRRLLRALPMLFLLAVIPISLYLTTGSLLEGSVHTQLFPWHEYLATQMRVNLTYLRLISLPINQTLDYDYPVFSNFTEGPVVASLVALALLLALTAVLVAQALKDHRRFGLPAFGMAFYFIAHSVESSAVSIVEIISEHRIYLPLAGFLIAISSSLGSAAVGRWCEKMGLRRLIAGALALAVLFSALAFTRNALWRNPVGFWEDAVSKAPFNWRALTYLGEAYLENGNYTEAVRTLRRATENIRSQRISTEGAYVLLGDAHMAIDSNDEALKAYEDALSIWPKPSTFIRLARVQSTLGLYGQAIASANEAVSKAPRNPEGFNALGLALALGLRYDEAFKAFGSAITLDPSYGPAYYNRALARLETGDREGANEDLEALRRIGSPLAAQLEVALGGISP